eukprot:2200204-Amphidinium_carterae.1
MCWGVPLRHLSRTQSTIALSSTDAELYAMGQARMESQHIKQIIEEMAIPEMDTEKVTMMINTDCSFGKAVASRLRLNRKSKHVHLRFLYILNVIQRGELTIKKIPTTRNPTDVLTKLLSAATIHTMSTDTTIRGIHPLPSTIGMITTVDNGEKEGPWRFRGGQGNSAAAAAAAASCRLAFERLTDIRLANAPQEYKQVAAIGQVRTRGF